MGEDAPIDAFLRQFWLDQDAGIDRPLAEYLQRFPGDDSAIARAWIDVGGNAGDKEPPGTRPPGSRALGPYELLEEIGRGGMGVVHRAIDTRVGRSVALKLLSGMGGVGHEALARFRREAEVAARLEHPGICRLYETDLDAEVPYIAMELVRGTTLARRITSRDSSQTTLVVSDREGEGEGHSAAPASSADPPSERDAILELLAIGEALAEALHAAHRQGVLHRDIKPGNVMIREDGSPVLMDFGLARDLGPEESRLTMSGVICGTPVYMSPEQVDGSGRPLDERTDIWSLGVTLYECLTHRLPFDAPNLEGLHHAILTREPEDPRRLNPALSRDVSVILATMLDKDPERRYRDAREVAADLGRCRRNEPIAARPVTTITRARRWVQRNPAMAGSFAVAALALAVGLAVALFFLGRARDSESDAQDRAREARRRLTDWDRLADGQRLDELFRRADDELWPASPERVPALRAWVAEADLLLASLPEHVTARENLRSLALPYGERDRERERPRREEAERRLAELVQELENGEQERKSRIKELAELEEKLARLDDIEDPQPRHEREMNRIDNRITSIERRLQVLKRRGVEWARALDPWRERARERTSWSFDDHRLQFQHDRLTALIEGLRSLKRDPHPTRITYAGVAQRLETAAALERITVADHREAWRAAADRVRADDRYGGLELRPQVGLIPLGPDPESGLEEFTETLSGRPARRPAKGGRVTIGTEEAMVFVLVPGGEFTMGAQREKPELAHYDPEAHDDESPTHRIRLDPFLLSKFEMTQAQWQRVAGRAPSYYGERRNVGGYIHVLSHPVEQVTLEECERILARVGLVVPTEAQWEYACRAAVIGRRWFADEDFHRFANIADQHARSHGAPPTWAFAPWSDGWTAHAPVGSLAPNPWGFHDQFGNVWEWCLDYVGPYERPAREGDGFRMVLGTRSGTYRGGCFDSAPVYSRISARGWGSRTSRTNNIGVRPARRLMR